jgi:hypothetical protein
MTELSPLAHKLYLSEIERLAQACRRRSAPRWTRLATLAVLVGLAAGTAML